MDDLETKVRHLAACRRARDEAKAMYNAAFEAFLIDHELLVGQKDRCIADVIRADDAVRSAALAAYAQSHEQRLCRGVAIRVTRQMEYDVPQAFAWALEHKLALAFDHKGFEKLAAATPLPFVQITERPQVTIATDLDTALERGSNA